MQTEQSAPGSRVAAGDVLAFVALAISVALAVGVVLCVSVLLLAAAAHAGCSEPKCKGTLYTSAPVAGRLPADARDS